MKPSDFLLLAVLLPSLVRAEASPRTPVSDTRELMVQAITAANGEAHGILIGSNAEAISRRFDTSSPILIDVTTERRYRQADCSRLRVQFSQAGVHLPGAQAPRRQVMEFGINFCRDGLPPRSLE